MSHHVHWNLKHMRKWLAWRFGWTDLGRCADCCDGHKTRKHNLCHKFLSLPSLFLFVLLLFSAPFPVNHSGISIPLCTMINKATLYQVLLYQPKLSKNNHFPFSGTKYLKCKWEHAKHDSQCTSQ